MRSNPDQLGIVIRQTHSPAYAEAPEERWDRTYATWPEGKSNNARRKTVFGYKQADQHVKKYVTLQSYIMGTT